MQMPGQGRGFWAKHKINDGRGIDGWNFPEKGDIFCLKPKIGLVVLC